MCKYATEEKKCVYEDCDPQPSFCRFRKVKCKLMSAIGMIPARCPDFIGIPTTNDAWYKELMAK